MHKQNAFQLATETSIPIVIGVAAFLFFLNPMIVIPTNIAWLTNGPEDPTKFFLGWHYFRNHDWSFPLGANPNYGLELGSSIVYSNSNPLLALIFKPFSAVLPDHFQYFGIWLLICFVLQSWFGYKIASLISNDKFIQVLITGFFLISPPMLFRQQFHYNLAGHFMILASIYLSLKPALSYRTHSLAWATLISISILVHAYLFIMVFSLYLTDNISRVYSKQRSLQLSLFELPLILLMTTTIGWIAGYFMIDNPFNDGGYGYYRMDLLALVDSDGWSFLIKDLESQDGEYEGFSYLGTGMLLLVFASVLSSFSIRGLLIYKLNQYKFFLALSFILTIFAISTTISIGPIVFSYQIPQFLEEIADNFRASGRFFWPVFYLIFIFIFYSLTRSLSNKAARILLSLALIIQIIDLNLPQFPANKAVTNSKQGFKNSFHDELLQSAFWEDAVKRYSIIRGLYPKRKHNDWKHFSSIGALYNLPTDMAFLARVDENTLNSLNISADEALVDGSFSKDTLYILDIPALRMACRSFNKEHDLITSIDGIFILAPDWKKTRDNSSNSIYEDICGHETQIDVYRTSQMKPYLTSGWS
jgi:hypothetical protein